MTYCNCKTNIITLQVDHDIIIGENQDGELDVLETKVEKSTICDKCGGKILQN